MPIYTEHLSKTTVNVTVNIVGNWVYWYQHCLLAGRYLDDIEMSIITHSP